MDFENSLILLHLLWILPMFGLITYYASSKRKKILIKIFGSHSEESQYTTTSKGRRYLKIWLMLFAIILLVIAAARPRWGWRILPFSGRGRDVMIVLDVSKSMNSTDVQPTRLKHAKLFIRNLIKKCPGDRFGLVAFAGSAFLDCPLTVDKTSLFQTLDEIDCNSIPLGGTNVENALNTAISAFKAAEGGYRAIVLLTDGDELHGDSSKSIETLKKMKIPLFIVGVGDPDGDGLIKLPGVNGKTVLMRDSKGDLVKSRLNERQLKKLKDAAGGIYVRSTATSSELNTITKKIQGLVPKEYEKGNNKRPIERFHFPLFVAVILLLLILGISERRKERKNGNGSAMKSSAVVIFLLIFSLSLQAQNKTQNKEEKKLPNSIPIAEGIKPTGGPTSGIKKTEDNASKVKKKLSAVELYNKALKLQKENKIEDAAKLYNKAINRADGSPEVRGKSFQNLGVISHAQARAVMQKDQDKALEILKKSEIMYKEAMRSDTHLKKVILNQQKLLDDRVLAKKIKKMREEMKKKQEQARKKTKEALDEQKKQNKQDKMKQDKKKKDEKKKDKKQQKQKQQQKKNKQNKQEQKQNKESEQDQKKSEQNKKSKNDENKSNQQKSKEKLKEAQKAVDELEKEAKKRGDKKVEESAKKAKKELKKAEEKQKAGEGKKSEEHIKKALDKLGKPKENKKKDSDKKKKKDGKQGKDKKDKKDKKGQPQNKNRKLDKGKKEDGKKGETKPKKEQDIDPRQAKAILEMMANDEKNLRDAIKENQKTNSQTRKVLKDW